MDKTHCSVQRPCPENCEQFITFKRLRENMAVGLVDDSFDVSRDVHGVEPYEH